MATNVNRSGLAYAIELVSANYSEGGRRVADGEAKLLALGLEQELHQIGPKLFDDLFFDSARTEVHRQHGPEKLGGIVRKQLASMPPGGIGLFLDSIRRAWAPFKGQVGGPEVERLGQFLEKA